MNNGIHSVETEQPIPKCLYKIRLVVRDIDASLKFYADFLGIRTAWTEKEDDGHIQVVALDLYDQEFILVGPDNADKIGADTAEQQPTRHSNGVSLSFEVDDIQQWFARAQHFGYAPLSPITLRPVQRPVKRPGGEISFALIDPDGYDIRISRLW